MKEKIYNLLHSKFFKILAVITISASFLLNAFVITGLIIDTIQRNKDNIQTEVLATTPLNKPSNNAVESSFDFSMFWSDFLDLTYVDNQYKFISEPGHGSASDNIGNTGKTYIDFLNGDLITITNLTSRRDRISSDGSVIESFSGPLYQCSKMTIQRNVVNPAAADEYSICWYYTNATPLYYEFRYIKYQYSEWYYQWNASLIYWNNGVKSVLSDNDYRNVFTFAKDNYSNWLVFGNPNYTNYYNEGYDAGYDNGFYNGEVEGEKNGYNNGYYAGLQAGQEGESNIFSLVKGAFNAIAGILDIQLLPGLNLGLLIFTPILVSIIIVIVKMIKG